MRTFSIAFEVTLFNNSYYINNWLSNWVSLLDQPNWA